MFRKTQPPREHREAMNSESDYLGRQLVPRGTNSIGWLPETGALGCVCRAVENPRFSSEGAADDGKPRSLTEYARKSASVKRNLVGT